MTITFQNKEYVLPQSWSEVNATQLAAVAPILLSGTDIDTAKPLIINALLQWEDAIVKAIKKAKSVDLLYSDIAQKLYPLIQWVFTDKNITVNVIPTISINRKYKFLGADVLHGPADEFNNLTIGEFDDAEYWFNQYLDSNMQNAHALHMLIAILYRAAKPKYIPDMGDIRQPYNYHLNELRAAQIATISTGIQKAILLWYMGCRAKLVEDYKFLFDKKKTTGNGLNGWTPIVYELAGGKFGTLEDTNNQLLKSIFYELRLMDIKRAELEAKYPELYKK